VPFADSQAVARAVTDVLGMNDRDRVRIGEMGRQHVIEAYDALRVCLPATGRMLSEVCGRAV
jgi:hypothetical protein